MVDISKQITYWSKGAEDDWQVAVQLIESGKTRHGLFFAHLALEKMLKAHVCKHTNEIAPRSHNLIRLAELSGLTIEESRLDVLAEMNEFNLEGRYPVDFISSPTIPDARKDLRQAKEVFEWLSHQL